MNDDEARYLIDQFNKYASWASRGAELAFSAQALAVAFWALMISVMNLLGFFSWILPPWNTVMVAVFVIPVMGLMVLSMRHYRKVDDEYRQDRRRLIALMDHYSKCRFLPDILTFATIVKWKPDQLKKALADSQPHRSPAS
ncbi:hypothetical protein MUP05_03710 [Candidatus Bathyarchaeota archaeon]|nr:hypothetical protein [Candidatus Bathyarchaeota archaeon]